MAEIKTNATKLSPMGLVQGIDDRGKRTDVKTVAVMMCRATGNRSRLGGVS